MSYWDKVENIGLSFVAPKEFLCANGFTYGAHYNNQKHIEMILKSGTFSSYGFVMEQENIPHLDHAIIYKNPSSKVCCLVYIPYNDADDIREEVKQWAEGKGLKAKVYENSWYNDETCLVIVSLPSVDIALS